MKMRVGYAEALKRGDSSVLEEYVHIKEVTHLESLVIGPAFVVPSLLKQLGIFQLIQPCLSVKHFIAIIVERVVSLKPLSVMALRRLVEKEAVSFLLNEESAPSLKTRYVLCHNPRRNDEDRRTRERLLDLTEEKLACIRSNATRLRETTEELRDHYNDLKYVEQAFRTMKTTDIQTRPIRHFNEPNVRGHIFACFLAYRVVWELRDRLSPVLTRDPDTKRCEDGSLADI